MRCSAGTGNAGSAVGDGNPLARLHNVLVGLNDQAGPLARLAATIDPLVIGADGIPRLAGTTIVITPPANFGLDLASVFSSLVVLAVTTRVSADFLPRIQASHYIHAALLWAAALAWWSCRVLPGMLRKDPAP